jgi:hypothetical protein
VDGLTGPARTMDRLPAGPALRLRFAASPLSWRALLAAAVLSLLAGVAMFEVFASGHSAVPSAARSDAASRTQLGLSGLPPAAQAAASAALGAADPAYRVTATAGALQARSRPQSLNESFSPSGMQLSSGSASVGLSLQAAGYGSSLQAVGEVQPSVKANRVTYAHRSFSEWYSNGPAGLEQGFTIQRALSGDSSDAPLTLSMALAGNTRASLSAGGQGLVLSHAGSSSLQYDGLIATDATGRALHSWMSIHTGAVQLRVDTSGAHYPLRIDPLIQQGGKLTGGAEEGEAKFAASAALSADGNTALVASPAHGSFHGAVRVFTRSESVWTQQAMLTGSEETGEIPEEQCIEEAGDEAGECSFGTSLALSADGNVALIGDPSATHRNGTAVVFARSNGKWSQEDLLTGPNENDEGRFGKSVALSADGTTALIGDPSAYNQHGAAWVFTGSGSAWTLQGPSLWTDNSLLAHAGRSVALSSDGSTALIGAPGDSGYAGAARAFTHSGSSWSTEPEPLKGGTEEGAEGHFGRSVALSGDGDTALIGAPTDGAGAAWVFVRSGARFTQQDGKLVGALGESEAQFGRVMALSGNGDTALIGAPKDGAGLGTARVFTRSGSASEGFTWTQLSERLAGAGAIGKGWTGASVALSADGQTALLGAPRDDHQMGAAWIFQSAAAPTVPPIVSRVAPGFGPAAGGTSVTISGANFTGATAVHFGSSEAAFVVESATTIVAVSPAEPHQLVHVTVTSAGTSEEGPADEFRFAAGENETLQGNEGDPKDGSTGTNTGSGGVLGFSGASLATSGCRIAVRNKHIAVQLHRSAAIRLVRSGKGACSGKLTLMYKQPIKGKTKGKHFTIKSLGTARFSILPGTSKVVKVTLNKTGRALLRAHHGRLYASLAIVRLSPVPVLGHTSSARLTWKKTPKGASAKK